MVDPDSTKATFSDTDLWRLRRYENLGNGDSLPERAADEIERLRAVLHGIIEVCESDKYPCNVHSFVEISKRAHLALGEKWDG